MVKLWNWLNNVVLPGLVGLLLVFIPLYPKWPLIGLTHTWVYIRLEDFLVLLTVAIWFLLFVRKKVKLPENITLPIFLFWGVGLLSTVIAVLFIFPHIANVFPKLAIFHYLRRIEYLVLLFVAFSTIKNAGDIKKYIAAIAVAMIGVVIYGFGQKIRLFPAYLTMNEEFAKGVPLFLPEGARITSTFGGHYDLAAYLVLMIPLLGSLVLGARKALVKIILLIIAVLALTLLLFTASRVSFAVYLITITTMLILQKKKVLIIPVLIFSLLMLTQVSGTAERFAKTIRLQSVVINTATGQPIDIAQLPPELGGRRPTPTPYEALPLGTGFISVMTSQPVATTVAYIKTPVSTELKLSSQSSEISTISGSFLIQKALVYDISFTTRFQGEWPRAWQAFERNILTGSGYSSISLATDGDYLRWLGETGILGFLSFLFIFFTYFLLYIKNLKNVTDTLSRSFVIGVTAGITGLFLNAVLIDVFEASKVALMLWPLMGISVGLLLLKNKVKINIFYEAKKFLTSQFMIFVYLLILIFAVYGRIFTFYFVGDDFTWLKWAAQSNISDLLTNFINADGFFYRPLTKILYFVAYSIFWLKPFGYHSISIFMFFGISIFSYLTAQILLKNRFKALLAAALVVLFPVNIESVVWVSSYSGMLMTLFVLMALFFFLKHLENKTKIFLIFSVICYVLAMLSHEAGTAFFAMVPFTLWLYTNKYTVRDKIILSCIYFILFIEYLYLRNSVNALPPSGDYNYNISNLPFNVIGNLAGYFSVTVFGSEALTKYELLRQTLKTNKTLAMILLSIITVIVFSVIKLFRNRFSKNAIYLIMLFVISLIPYLGLGNLAERYGLLASFFTAILIISLVNGIFVIIFKYHRTSRIFLSVILIIFIFYTYYQSNLAIQKNWDNAGTVTKKILYSLKDNYRQFPLKSTLYFVNVPIMLNRAWVFPVGLPEAVWFIYRDKTITVKRISSEAEGLKKLEIVPDSYLFSYDNHELKEIRWK